jgi:predicted permease
LTEGFLNDLNRFVFFVALPVFIVQSMAEVQVPAGEALRLFAVLIVCTLFACCVAWGLTFLLGSKPESRGSVVQAAFRGNLAYGGIPVIVYSLAGHGNPLVSEKAVGTALLVFAPLTACYNFLAVICLQRGWDWKNPASWFSIFGSILKNPLIFACLFGYFLACFQISLPEALNSSMKILGGVALPIALLCIGGSFIRIDFGGRYRSIWIAVCVKLLILPVLAWFGCDLLGIVGYERRIVMIFAAAPTAVTSYTMAKEMGADSVVTSAAVALSTILAFFTLTFVLLFTEV